MTEDEDIDRLPPTPRRSQGFCSWGERRGEVAVRFLGRGPRWQRDVAVARFEGDGVAAAWARQIHSVRVLPAAAGGECGAGDALVTDRSALALVVATADCVPVLLATADGRLAAVHAGWRGLVAGVVPAAVAALAGAPGRVTAWVGPAIGRCCYEVGDEVAQAVAAASSAAAVQEYRGSRPHVDLVCGVLVQLRRSGIERPRLLELCTRCHGEWLWSHRGDGAGAGRNLAWIHRAGSMA